MVVSPPRRLGRWGLFLILVVSVGLSGCGGATGNISGKVSYKGAVLKGGSLTFVSSDKKPSVSTQINEDGTYTATRVPAGVVKVCVSTEALNPTKKAKVPKYNAPP